MTATIRQLESIMHYPSDFFHTYGVEKSKDVFIISTENQSLEGLLSIARRNPKIIVLPYYYPELKELRELIHTEGLTTEVFALIKGESGIKALGFDTDGTSEENLGLYPIRIRRYLLYDREEASFCASIMEKYDEKRNIKGNESFVIRYTGYSEEHYTADIKHKFDVLSLDDPRMDSIANKIAIVKSSNICPSIPYEMQLADKYHTPILFYGKHDFWPDMDIYTILANVLQCMIDSRIGVDIPEFASYLLALFILWANAFLYIKKSLSNIQITYIVLTEVILLTLLEMGLFIQLNIVFVSIIIYPVLLLSLLGYPILRKVFVQ